jgi:hypothetical protein
MDQLHFWIPSPSGEPLGLDIVWYPDYLGFLEEILVANQDHSFNVEFEFIVGVGFAKQANRGSLSRTLATLFT